MKKILYLMGIDWHWIKQRPQIIAEQLSQDYEVTVAYQKEVFQRGALQKETDELEKSIAIPVIPYRDKNRLIFRIQKCFWRKVIKRSDQFDIIWITHPLLYRYIPSMYTGKIVYDCMDNHKALCNDLRIKNVIDRSEKELINRSDLIFASSSRLQEKIEKQGGTGKCVLVRNGFVFSQVAPPSKRIKKNRYKIGYVGTIAEWLDLELLLDSLEKFPNLEYHLWGPKANFSVPSHPRLVFEGVVEHANLGTYVKDMDALIMPFKVNDIIEDVDPVKLYEYISFGKPILSVYYKEIERFESYVYFYKGKKEYLELLIKMFQNGFEINYTYDSQKEFLQKNTWNYRYQTMLKRLQNI